MFLKRAVLMLFLFLKTACSGESPSNLREKSDNEGVAMNPENVIKSITYGGRALQSSNQESINMIVDMVFEFVDLYKVYFRRSTCYFLNQCVTDNPTVFPSLIPSAYPSAVPTIFSSTTPTSIPSVFGSSVPSLIPTMYPSENPSISLLPSIHIHPSNFPSVGPSLVPTIHPSVVPTKVPTAIPSTHPSVGPSLVPTIHPSVVPTEVPSAIPSAHPSTNPSTIPSISLMPTTFPGFESATQSSTWGGLSADRCIDGDTNQQLSTGQSCNHTDDDATGPWWEGTLNRSTTMSQITIYNRQDCCASRIVGFTLSIRDDNDNILWSWTDSSGSAQSIYVIDTSSSPAGSKVRVQLNRQDFLHMAEVVIDF